MAFKAGGFLLVAVALVCSQASAASLSLDFTADEGFVDDFLNTQLGAIAQGDAVNIPGGFSVDTSGTGTVSTQTNGFLRAIFLSGDSELEAFASSSSAGDTATLTLGGLNINRGLAAIPVAVFGLTSDDGAGTAGNEIGLQLAINTDGDILLDEQLFGVSGGAVDTGFNVGDTFDASVVITNNGDGTFDANATVGSATLLTADNVSFAGEATPTGIIFQNQGFTTGTASFDSISAEIVSGQVPEPMSLTLLALGGLMLPRRRR